MLEHIEKLLKEDKILECISYLRGNTKCFSLIKILCEKIENDNNYEKNLPFWNDYSIANYYLENKDKAFKLYENIFPYSETPLKSEFDVEFYHKNMLFSFPNFKQNNKMVYLEELLKEKIEYKSFNKFNEDIFNSIEKTHYPMNPTIIKSGEGYLMNIRTVNYLFDSEFRYIINGPCYTINYLLDLNKELNIERINKLNYQEMPFKGNFDGWEDMRLFYYKNKVHCSFTTLQATSDRRQTICLSNLSDELPKHIKLDNYGSSKIQKNWVPLVSKSEELFFIYSFFPLTILKYHENKENVELHQVSKVDKINNWRGGSPAISLKELGYENYYICVIHESEFPKYKHKFILLEEINENIFKIKNETDFFYFMDAIIEFCSGITISHNKNNFILSFGKMDKEASLTNISIEKILKLLII